MNTRSLPFRLVVWHAALLTIIVAVLGCCTYVAVKFQMEKNLADNQLRRANLIASTVVANVAKTGDAFVSEQIRSRFIPETNSWFIRVLRPDASILYGSGNPTDQSFDASALPFPRHVTSSPTRRHENIGHGRKLLIATVPVATESGQYLVEVGSPLDRVQMFMNRMLVFALLGFPILLGVSLVGGHVLVKQALAPVQKACRSAEEITSQNLSQRLAVISTGDELEQLTTALNRMIARLEDAFLHNHRFMADASHEMRTPLTIIRGELETMVDDPGLGKEARDTVGSILEEVERLVKIVDNLFAMARLDAGEMQGKRSTFDLSKLAATTAEQMLLMAEDKGISIKCNAPAPVPLEGDRSRLKQVVVNLLDNAIKYTPAGGSIEVLVKQTDRKATLEVIDNGIGIPIDAQPHLFERFFRVDKARSREMGGAGLGLAIVNSICATHGGTIEVESAEGQGSRFKVELPKAPG
jgi:heavy metal sensor kinase